MRCFVAVEIPADVKEALARIAGGIRPFVTGARWARPEAMHVTLEFLGELASESGMALSEALRRAEDLPPFRLGFRGLRAFPRARAARVLWAGAGEGAEEAVRLAEAVRRIAEAAGIGEKDGGKYVPHLTIARFREPLDLERIEVFQRARETEIGACWVSRFVLFRSLLRSGGAVHEPLSVHPLAGKPG